VIACAGRFYLSSDQPQPLQARVAVLADDDVVMHRDAERLPGVDHRLGHLDVGAGRRRIARGVVVHEAAAFVKTMILRRQTGSGASLVPGIGGCCRCLIVIITANHPDPRGVALMHGNPPYSFDPTHQVR
jgi:hypothetical protein